MVTFDIARTLDLQDAISEYTNLCRSGYSGRVELVIAAGATIGPTSWSLVPPMGASRVVPIDVAIVGNGGSLPLFDAIVARTVHIEDVVLTDRAQAIVWVAQDFTMKHAMLVDVRRGAPAGQGVVQILANGGPTKPTTVTFEDAWFVRNYQGERPERLIHLTARGEHAGRFGAVRVTRCAFLGNAFAADLSVEGASRVEVEDSVFYRSWDGGTELACSGCGELALRRSELVLVREDQVATVDGTPFHKEQVAIACGGSPDLDSVIAAITGPRATLPNRETWGQVRAFVHARTSSHFTPSVN